MASLTRARGGRASMVVAVAGVLGFWGVAFLAATLVPDYSVRADYTSSLAGRGSSVAALGIAALALLAVAHAAAAVVVSDRSRPLACWLALAALGGAVTTGFRTGCPLGAAGCGFGANDAPTDLADRLHVVGVGTYQVALLAAMAAVLLAWVRRRRPGWLAVATVLAAPVSLLLLAQVGGPDAGAWQRAWLVVTTGWLLLLLADRLPPTRPGVRRAGASPGRTGPFVR